MSMRKILVSWLMFNKNFPYTIHNVWSLVRKVYENSNISINKSIWYIVISIISYDTEQILKEHHTEKMVLKYISRICRHDWNSHDKQRTLIKIWFCPIPIHKHLLYAYTQTRLNGIWRLWYQIRCAILILKLWNQHINSIYAYKNNMCIYKKKISVLHVTMFARNFKSFFYVFQRQWSME